MRGMHNLPQLSSVIKDEPTMHSFNVSGYILRFSVIQRRLSQKQVDLVENWGHFSSYPVGSFFFNKHHIMLFKPSNTLRRTTEEGSSRPNMSNTVHSLIVIQCVTLSLFIKATLLSITVMTYSSNLIQTCVMCHVYLRIEWWNGNSIFLMSLMESPRYPTLLRRANSWGQDLHLKDTNWRTKTYIFEEETMEVISVKTIAQQRRRFSRRFTYILTDSDSSDCHSHLAKWLQKL